MTRIVGLCRQRSVLRRLHGFSSPLGYTTFSSTTITSTDPGPWTPTVSTSSRSADRDGPLTQTRPDGRSVAAAADLPSGLVWEIGGGGGRGSAAAEGLGKVFHHGASHHEADVRGRHEAGGPG